MKNKDSCMSCVFELILTVLAVLAVCTLAFLFRVSGSENRETVESIADLHSSITIVLDAGHGGGDSGASVDGVLEKDLNLSITRKIREFLRLYDVDICLTRDGDFLLADEASTHKKRDDLFNRVDIARKFDSPVFVSIHMNKFPESKYRGFQVFYSSNSPYSEALALVMRDNNVAHLDCENSRDIKKATSSIYVLDRLECPAVLVECGFLSNPVDLKNLCDEQYQNKLAFVIANSIIEYIKL